MHGKRDFDEWFTGMHWETLNAKKAFRQDYLKWRFILLLNRLGPNRSAFLWKVNLNINFLSINLLINIHQLFFLKKWNSSDLLSLWTGIWNGRSKIWEIAHMESFFRCLSVDYLHSDHFWRITTTPNFFSVTISNSI